MGSRSHFLASLRRAVYALTALALIVVPARAQQSATATLGGVVSDPNGAVISGAQVTATQKATGVKRETTTNEDGFYTLSALPPGEYEVKVQAQGFAHKVVAAVIALQVGQGTTLDVTLQIASTTLTVTVDEVNNVPLLDTLSSDVDGVITAAR